jgi:hypothetical protein
MAFPPYHPAQARASTRRLARIGQVHQLRRPPQPRVLTLIRETMRSIRRALGVAPPTSKRAVTTAGITAAVAHLGDILAAVTSLRACPKAQDNLSPQAFGWGIAGDFGDGSRFGESLTVPGKTSALRQRRNSGQRRSVGGEDRVGRPRVRLSGACLFSSDVRDGVRCGCAKNQHLSL